MVSVSFMTPERTIEEAAKYDYQDCKVCGRKTLVRKDGTLLRHNKSKPGAKRRVVCKGSGETV